MGVYDYIDGPARLFHFVFLSLFRFLYFQPSLPLDGAQLYGQLFQLFGIEPAERLAGDPGIQAKIVDTCPVRGVDADFCLL